MRHSRKAIVALAVVIGAAAAAAPAQVTSDVSPRAPAAQAKTPRLRVEGRRIVRAGQPFVWRFASAFSLVAQVAHGRTNDARAFLQWVADAGFNGVRAFTMLPWAHLSPEAGRAALGDALALAGEYGLYVEVVAIADARTFGLTPDAMRAHVREVGQIAAAHPNAVVELANENAHRLSLPILTDPAFLRELHALIPDTVPVSHGSGPEDGVDNYPGGDYITIHLARRHQTWEMVNALRALEELSRRSGRFVVSDEPAGADEKTDAPSRSSDVSLFHAFGALSRMFSIGATFHFEAGLRNETPGPVQRAAAKAFIEGTRVVPDDVELRMRNAGELESPVRTLSGAAGVYAGLSPGANIVVATGTGPSFSPQLREGWRVTRTISKLPGIQVLEIARGK